MRGDVKRELSETLTTDLTRSHVHFSGHPIDGYEWDKPAPKPTDRFCLISVILFSILLPSLLSLLSGIKPSFCGGPDVDRLEAPEKRSDMVNSHLAAMYAFVVHLRVMS